MTLARLPRRQAAELTHQVAQSKTLPAEVLEQVVAKTDGVPLFVEELTKTVLESGLLQEREDHYVLTGPLPPLAIPATLHDSLLARLDRLAAAKGLAQLGATLGREFPYTLLQAVAPWDEETLRTWTAPVGGGGVAVPAGTTAGGDLRFKHALIQEAAYQSLLRSTRQQYHQRLRRCWRRSFPRPLETQPELLAHHYTEAGLRPKPFPTGSGPASGPSNVRPIWKRSAHLTQGLELLATLPDTPERAQQELDLQITLGPALMTTRGQAAPEVLHAYARARAFCQQMGETPQLFQVLRGYVVFYLIRVELQTAQELGEQLLTLAQQVGDPALLLEAHTALGTALNYLGELPRPRPISRRGSPSTIPAAPALPSATGGPRRVVPRLCRPDPVVAGRSRPGPAAEPRGVDAGPGAGAPLQPGFHPVLCGLVYQLRREWPL